MKTNQDDCTADLIDALYPYCKGQQMLAYTKGNLDKLIKRKYNLSWLDIKPSTPIEEKMADGLKSAGLLHIPQYQAYSAEHRYKIDFVIKTNNGLSLAIECDGLQFHARPGTYIRDRVRDRYLQLRGFHILRFSSIEIFNEINQCVTEIEEAFRLIQQGKLSLKTDQRIGYFGILNEDDI